MKECLKKMSIIEMVLFALTTLVLVSLLIFTFTGSNLRFNSDTATANILAEEMVRTGQYFPRNWNGGQDLWAFFLHTFIAFFTLFSDDYLFMRSLSCTVFIIMAVVSCIYCSRKAMKNNSWLVSVPLLFCGISNEYSTVVFGQCAYVSSLTYTIFFIALLIDSIDTDTLKIRSLEKFLVLLFLMSFIGLNGVRQIQIFGLPMAGTIVIYYFINNYKKPVKEFLKDSKSAAITLLGIMIAIIVGYMGFKYCSSLVNFTVGGANVLLSDMDIFSRIKTFFNLFISLFGIAYGAPLLSLEGIFNVIKIFMGILLLVVFPVLQIKDFNKECSSIKIFSIFAVLHIAEIFTMCIFCAVLSDSPRYLFTSEFLLLFLSSHYIYKKLVQNQAQLLRLVTALAMCVYILPLSVPKLLSFVGYKDSLAYVSRVANFLLENDLSYGYSTYWNASVNTCLSNGKVEINSIYIADRVAPYYWLNSKDRYEANEGRSFLLLTEEENQYFVNSKSFTEFGEAVSVLYFENFIIYVYDYNIAHNNFEGTASVERTIEKLKTAYGTNAVYYYDSALKSFSQFRDFEYYPDAAMCGNGQLIVSNNELVNEFSHMGLNVELADTFEEYYIYYSQGNRIDCLNGLPYGEQNLSIDYMYTLGVANSCIVENGKYITSGEGGCAFYGPYAPTYAGTYRFTLHYNYLETNNITEQSDVFDVCVDTGGEILNSAQLDPMGNAVSVIVDFTNDKNFEYRLWVNKGAKIEIEYIEMEKIA